MDRASIRQKIGGTVRKSANCAFAWGAKGHEFKSRRSDHFKSHQNPIEIEGFAHHEIPSWQNLPSFLLVKGGGQSGGQSGGHNLVARLCTSWELRIGRENEKEGGHSTTLLVLDCQTNANYSTS